MYESLLERLVRNIVAVKKQIQLSGAIRSMVGDRSLKCTNAAGPCFDIGAVYDAAPDNTDWRIIDHCSAVTRLYAVYERFVEEILGAHLQFLEQNVAYENLDEKFRLHHRRSIGQILLELDKDRYKDTLSFDSILDDISGIFHGQRYRLLPQAMLAHDQNLRMKDLANLFERCGISNVQEWVNRHRALKTFFLEGRQSDKAEAELNQLVQYRNDAAHGGIDVTDLLGADVLVEYSDFIVALCGALAERVQRTSVDTLEALGRTHKSGIITEVFSERRVVAIVGGGTFKRLDRPYLCGDHYCFRATVESIQQNDESKESITILGDSELGIQFDIAPIKRASIYYIHGE